MSNKETEYAYQCEKKDLKLLDIPGKTNNMNS